MAVFFADEADADLVALASPFPLPALLDGVDLPLLPALAADLFADELPPDADFELPPELLFVAAFDLPADDVPLLVPVDELRLAVDEEADDVFFFFFFELLLAVELLLLLADPADFEVLFAVPLLLPAEDDVLLLPPLLLFEPPLLFVLPDADFLLLPDEPVLLLAALLLPELLPVLRDDDVRDDRPLEPVPFLPLVAELVLPDIIDDEPEPSVTLFIAESEAPTTAPVAAPATISPTRSFALS